MTKVRWFNWKRFLLLFGLFQVAFLVCGCTAQWLSAVSSMLPALQAAVSAAISFVMALEGKTISASVSQAIQKIGQDIAGQIANVQTLIADFKQNASTGTLSQIQAVFQGIVQNLGSILSNANVTDPSTTSKLTQLIGLAVAAAQAIIALLPLVGAKLASGASTQELEAEDKLAAKRINSAKSALEEDYAEIISEKTSNTDVNAALDSLPKSLA